MHQIRQGSKSVVVVYQCSCVCDVSENAANRRAARKDAAHPRASPGAACNYAFQPYSALCCFPCLNSASTLKAARPPWLVQLCLPAHLPASEVRAFFTALVQDKVFVGPVPAPITWAAFKRSCSVHLLRCSLSSISTRVQCHRTSPHDKTPLSHLRSAVMQGKLLSASNKSAQHNSNKPSSPPLP